MQRTFGPSVRALHRSTAEQVVWLAGLELGARGLVAVHDGEGDLTCLVAPMAGGTTWHGHDGDPERNETEEARLLRGLRGIVAR